MTPCCCVRPPAPVPQSHPKKESTWTFTKTLETVSAIALCTFAAYLNSSIFILSVAAGAIYQFIKIAYRIKQEGLGFQRPGCGQGFGELISQLKLLEPEIVLATAYVAWRHLMHDPIGFVPFVGFFVGMSMAYRAVCYLRRPNGSCSLANPQPIG